MNNIRKIKPITTLFMLMSVDGKISTGAVDELDVDRDYPRIEGVKEGVYQYYEIEKTTDLWSLNSGRVQEKVGVNQCPLPTKRSMVSFVLLDNNHLTLHGIEYFVQYSKNFVLVTSNSEHPAFSMNADNLHILYYENLDLHEMMKDLYQKFGCNRITIQTGGTLNGMFLREKLFDYVDIIVAPILVGGGDTPTLIDGESIRTSADLYKLGVLQLEKAETLMNSYIRLSYKVIK